MGYTHGYTNWLWKSKCGDIGFWYQTLKQAQADVDRASYERSIWDPEASENTILQRHYDVLVSTFGPSMMPCALHLMPHKAFFDLWAWSLLPTAITAIALMIVQAVKSDSLISGKFCSACMHFGAHNYRYMNECLTCDCRAPKLSHGSFWTYAMELPDDSQ